MQNLLHGGFEGPIMPVNPSERAISGVLAYPRISHLPVTPDLAIVCGSHDTVDETIRQLGQRGTRAAILMADRLSATHTGCVSRYEPVLKQARSFKLRVLGPDCIGVMVPGIGLNASIAHAPALPGGVAFVSQSSTIGSAVLDWARQHDIGFSYFISLGSSPDIDFADVIDYLGNDAMTRAILLYVEEVRNGRAFMSACRGASRNKPILLIKSGRTPEGRFTTFGEVRSGGHEDVYDAAFRRAGMLRVNGFGELFTAVEALGRAKPLKAERLAVLANGRGIAALTVDALLLSGGSLAALTEDTQNTLLNIIPEASPIRNAVVFDGDTPPACYGQAARLLLADPNVDALMVVHAPASSVNSSDAANAVIAAVKEKRGAALTTWMGGERVEEARRLFAEAGIPTYDTPTQAVAAFMHMVRYRRNQELLMQTPASKPVDFAPQTDSARVVVEELVSRGETLVIGREAKTILSAYGIETAETRIAKSPEDAATVASQLGFPVALKVRSPDIQHKGEIGGVDLFLDSPDSVRNAAVNILETVHQRRPTASVQGFTIERMVLRPGAHEVMIAVAEDPLFGPVITFGHGGPASNIIGDRAVALPPLNMSLARDLIFQTRISKLLKGYGDFPPADLEALCLILVQVSQMIVDLPELAALELNPVFVDHRGVFCVDAWIKLAPPTTSSTHRLCICPYPQYLEEDFTLKNGRKVLLRPIIPEDEPVHYEFLSKVSAEDIRLRFFHQIRSLPHTEMARLTQIDYDREMAFIATAPKEDGTGRETLGVVRIMTDPGQDNAEYAILIRSDLKGQGLGYKLMTKIIEYCRSRGTRRITGLILSDNKSMLNMVRRLGFSSRRVPEDDVMEVTLNLLED